MKYLALAAIAAIAQAEANSPARPASDLRSAVVQVQGPGAASARPRQLSETERAQLRRQLSEFNRKSAQ
jgi:hypothetical protein